jgi:hypothetical protein
LISTTALAAPAVVTVPRLFAFLTGLTAHRVTNLATSKAAEGFYATATDFSGETIMPRSS